jgi:hypothetical protein
MQVLVHGKETRKACSTTQQQGNEPDGWSGFDQVLSRREQQGKDWAGRDDATLRRVAARRDLGMAAPEGRDSFSIKARAIREYYLPTLKILLLFHALSLFHVIFTKSFKLFIEFIQCENKHAPCSFYLKARN